MSQRAGDFGSIMMGCSNTTNLKKYGSYDACMKEREKEKAIQDMLARRNPLENPKGLTNKQIQQERIRIKQQQLNGTVTQDVTLPSGKQLQEGDLELTIKRIIKAPYIYLRFMGLSDNQARIIYYSLIGVGGYFAYKKFKK